MKIFCLLMPHFPWHCEVLRHPELDSRSVVITYTSNSRKLILDFAPKLKGLQSGMPVHQALARYWEAELIPVDMPCYRSVFTRILDTLEGVSTLVEGAELGCVYLGADGLQLIYPDDESIIKAILGTIPGVFATQIGLAGNKFLAYLSAQSCSPRDWQVLNGDAAAFLWNLSCDVLPVSMKSKEKLHSFGLHTLGQVATLPPGPMLSQFGPEGKRIHELARGYDVTPLCPRMMAEAIEERTVLSSVAVSLEAIVVTLEALLDRVFARIGQVGLGINSLNVWTRTWNEEQWERTVKFKEPALGVRTAMARIKRVIEEYPQPGPVEQAGLIISRLGFPSGRQKSLLREIRSRDHLMQDIRQLELRLGNPQVYRVKEVETWSRIPERRYVLTPADH